MDSWIFTEIIVDDQRNNEVSNGLVDINRDIFMKLIKIVQDENKIRNVFNLIQIIFFCR
jgi:hypothetical protein